MTAESRIEQSYDSTATIDQMNPVAAFSGRFPQSVSPVSHFTVRAWDGTTGDALAQVQDFGDLASRRTTSSTTFSTRPSPARTSRASSTLDASANGPGTLLAQRESTYTVNNAIPAATEIRDLVIGGNQPLSGTPGTPYTGAATQVQASNITLDPGDLGNIGTLTDPTGYQLSYTYEPITETYVTGVTDSFGLTSSRTMNLDFGLAATTTDANAQVVTYSYDQWGRVQDVWGPTDPTTGQATIAMQYSQGGIGGPAWALTQHKDFQSATGDTIDTVTFADGSAGSSRPNRRRTCSSPTGRRPMATTSAASSSGTPTGGSCRKANPSSTTPVPRRRWCRRSRRTPSSSRTTASTVPPA